MERLGRRAERVLDAVGLVDDDDREILLAEFSDVNPSRFDSGQNCEWKRVSGLWWAAEGK